jgi:non-specific serine/threonine protein kinase
MTADHDRAVARTADRLGAEAYAEHFQAGRGLSFESAIREALEIHAATSVQRSTAPWSPLTERERDVAQLVASGLSNRSIAEMLMLGTRTVESHVSRILSKLQLTSRAQLAVWVNRRMEPATNPPS